MATSTKTIRSTSAPAFPDGEVRRRLKSRLQTIADEGTVLRPEWEPLLDSKRVVGTVLCLEDLFPFKIPPDQVVQKGGYNSVNEALDDMVLRVKKIWSRKQSKANK